MSGFRGSNLTKTMANLQDLESFEPLNPLTPDPDFGNLFCVFWQAIGEFQFAIPFFGASCWGIQQRAGPQNCSLLASYREIAHNLENGFYSLVSRCAYSFLLGIALPQKTFRKRFYKPKKPFDNHGTSFRDRILQRFRLHRSGPLSVCTQYTNFATELSTHVWVFFRSKRRILTEILQCRAPPCCTLPFSLLWPIEHQVVPETMPGQESLDEPVIVLASAIDNSWSTVQLLLKSSRRSDPQFLTVERVH